MRNVELVLFVAKIFIILIPKYTTSEKWTLKDCPKFVRSELGTDPDIILIKDQISATYTMEEAYRICRFCFDAFLPMHNETRNMGRSPKWIGAILAAGPNPNESHWNWMDGTPVGDWRQYADYYSDYGLSPDVTYGILQLPFDDKFVWLALEINENCNNQIANQRFRDATGFELACGSNGDSGRSYIRRLPETLSNRMPLLGLCAR